MAYVYFTSYALNKSATKHVAIALEVPKHSTRIILAKTMDKLEISLTPEEFKKFTEFIPTMTLLLRQDVASLQPEYISETLRVQVISIFDGKQVLLERVNEKMEVINSLYYCLGTWNNLEALLPCMQHLLLKYFEFAIHFDRMLPMIVNYARQKKPEVNFNTLHLNSFIKEMLQINPSDLPLDNCGSFDKIRCYYELVVYHPYFLALAFNNS